jgi:hypothetical protein
MMAGGGEGMVMKDQGTAGDERWKVVEAATRLFNATDNRDWSRVRDCFDESVLFDMSSLSGKEPAWVTPEFIISGWEEGLKDLSAVHHQIGNIMVEILGRTASLTCYGIAIHYLPNPSGRNTRTFVGSYDIRLVRKKGGWKISGFAYHSKFVLGNLNLGS